MTDHSDHNHSEEISTLNTLIATTIDSVTGYENSAKDIDNQRFAEIFRQRADERQQVVEDLRNEVRRLGGDPEDSGSFMGKTHQRFEDLKAAITGQDEQAVINEVERGEDYLKEKFETALNSDALSGEARSVVERCYQSVRSGHDQMSQLKHGLESPSNA
ncbi:MAG: PA2169 family four-helix-bundle protein [Sphingomonas sp.]|nr:PA2169 family four-helix-bundle protein [Sphingomonas sp.]